jgi:hypothetical protein
MRALLPLAAALALACSSSAFGQVQPKPAPKTSIFSQVVPKPTGRNGYEDLVLAAELLSNTPVFQKAKETSTLAQKRAVLSDRNVSRVFQLLNQGLKKPVLQPRENVTFSTLLPELQLFRDVARLLAMQQYVQLADGRIPEALATARMGIRFGNVIQMDTLIHGLIGIASSTICITPLGRHLDQLSARDCNTLYQICLEWLNQPSPQRAVLAGERKWMRTSLIEMRETAKKEGPKKAAALLGVEPGTIDTYQDLIPKSPEALDQLFVEVDKRMDQFYDLILRELEKAPWERKGVELPQQGDVPGALVGMLIPSYQSVDRAYIQEQARIQLLACHAAIRAYKWEHDRLPPNLHVLNLGDLARDPFTGEWLRYETKGLRYTLTSIGPPAGNPDDPRAINGRLPIGLTLDD